VASGEKMAFPDEAILSALMKELGWTHFVQLLPLEKPLQREFYPFIKPDATG